MAVIQCVKRGIDMSLEIERVGNYQAREDRVPHYSPGSVSGRVCLVTAVFLMCKPAAHLQGILLAVLEIQNRGHAVD